MKIKEGFRMRPLGDGFIVTGEGIAQVNFNKMISMNATAAFLWESLEGKDFTTVDVKRLLLDKYGIDDATAERDSAAIVLKWKEAGLVE